MKKSTIVFILLSVVASAISYTLYPVLSRLLPANQYIDITVALSLLTQISTFLSSIIAITIGLSKSEGNGKAQPKIEALQEMLFKLFIILVVVFLIISPVVMPSIDIPIQFVIPISIIMLASIPIATISGYLNGRAELMKLGILTVAVAGSQFLIASIVAFITRNGLIATLSMAAAQIITIFFAHSAFRNDNLPGIGKMAWKLAPVFSDKQHLKRLALYTLVASIALMALNLAQIADLLIIQTTNNGDSKFYADIYVVSRVVFFAGMIFVWPFLSEIDIINHRLNRIPLVKAGAVFGVISVGAIAGLYAYGDIIIHLMLGVDYELQAIRSIGVLSVLYKTLFLIITAVVLYFVVLHRYIAAWITAAVTTLILAYAVSVSNQDSTQDILVVLNIIAGAGACVSIVTFFLTKPSDKK